MANKKTKKKGAEATQAAPASKVEPKKADLKKADSKKASKKSDKKAAKAKDAKPGIIARSKKYISSVRSEMRVVWPSKKELVNYSIAVIVSLIVVGVVIAGLDALISGGLVVFSGLRG